MLFEVKMSTRQITLVGILGAITIALGFMPVGGFIPVPTPADQRRPCTYLRSWQEFSKALWQVGL